MLVCSALLCSVLAPTTSFKWRLLHSQLGVSGWLRAGMGCTFVRQTPTSRPFMYDISYLILSKLQNVCTVLLSGKFGFILQNLHSPHEGGYFLWRSLMKNAMLLKIHNATGYPPKRKGKPASRQAPIPVRASPEFRGGQIKSNVE